MARRARRHGTRQSTFFDFAGAFIAVCSVECGDDESPLSIAAASSRGPRPRQLAAAAKNSGDKASPHTTKRTRAAEDVLMQA
ncbi:MAG: hypothetical protein ACXW5J_31580 [Thermoanaerobaculia bacterium]